MTSTAIGKRALKENCTVPSKDQRSRPLPGIAGKVDSALKV